MTELKSLLARREPLYAESQLTIKTTGKRGLLTVAKELLFAQDSIKSFNDRKFT
jgi:hypothetical protein